MKKVWLVVAVIAIVIALISTIVTYSLTRRNRDQGGIAFTELEAPVISDLVTEPKTAKILFGGDLMFDRNIRLKLQQNGVDFALAPLEATFTEYDLVIANLEGPITDNPSRSLGSASGSTNNFIFTFDPSVAPMLKKYNFQIVNLGNNHILNMDVEGVYETKNRLNGAGVMFFGDTGTEASSEDRVLLYTLNNNGVTIGLVNYNEFTTNGYEHTLEDLAYARDKSDVIVVYTHWGAEYQPISNQVIQNQAHEFIDQGADLVIGSHPHVVQQVEEYQGKQIFYSLGNFVFDQYFSPETKAGLLVGVEVDETGFKNFIEIPILLENSGQTKLETQN